MFACWLVGWMVGWLVSGLAGVDGMRMSGICVWEYNMPISSSVSLNFHLTSQFSSIIFRSCIFWIQSFPFSFFGWCSHLAGWIFHEEKVKKKNKNRNIHIWEHERKGKSTKTTAEMQNKTSKKIISAKKRTRQMSYGNDRDEMKMNVTKTTLSS